MAARENIVLVTIRLTEDFERIDTMVELGLIAPISLAAMDHVLYSTFDELAQNLAEKIKLNQIKNPTN